MSKIERMKLGLKIVVGDKKRGMCYLEKPKIGNSLKPIHLSHVP